MSQKATVAQRIGVVSSCLVTFKVAVFRNKLGLRVSFKHRPLGRLVTVALRATMPVGMGQLEKDRFGPECRTIPEYCIG